MSLNTLGNEPTTGAVARPTQTASASSVMTNDAVIDAIRAHHAQLADQLRVRTDAVLAAARNGDCTTAAEQLHDWYRDVLIPHAVAEEQSLYSPAAELDSIRLLVDGMLAEHRFLVGQVADLARAAGPVDVAATAAAARAVFTVHLGKENDLLLPALDRAGADLATLLDGMHEILGHGPEADTDTEAGHECCGHGGCGCGGAHRDS